jgi:TrpR family trp operon transcriptional repressor
MTDLGTPDQEADLQSVTNALARLTSPDDVQALFDEILTPAERQSIALRWRLMQMLRDGIPQRRIAKQLSISLCKITRGSRVLKNPESMVRRLLNVERDAGAPPSQQDPR